MTDAPDDPPSDPSTADAERHVARLVPTTKFIKAYKGLSPDMRQRVDAALRKFTENPRHPGLHFEKLQGSAYRTIRPDRKMYRIVLRDSEVREETEGEVYDLVDVDRHAVVDRKYG